MFQILGHVPCLHRIASFLLHLLLDPFHLQAMCVEEKQIEVYFHFQIGARCFEMLEPKPVCCYTKLIHSPIHSHFFLPSFFHSSCLAIFLRPAHKNCRPPVPWQRFQTEGWALVCSNSKLVVKVEVQWKKKKSWKPTCCQIPLIKSTRFQNRKKCFHKL